MTLRDLAIILVFAIAVPVLLLVRLVPIGKALESDGRRMAQTFGRSQIWFYGGIGLAGLIILLLKFC